MSQDGRDALFIASDYRANFKNVIAKRSDLAQFDGGRLDASQYGQTLQAGTVMGIITASGLYKPYLSSASDGSQIPVGVLADYADPSAAGDGSEIVVIKSGILLKDLLVGYDANAKSVLGAKESVEHGVNLVRF